MGVEGNASAADIIKAVTDAGYGASLMGAGRGAGAGASGAGAAGSNTAGGSAAGKIGRAHV